MPELHFHTPQLLWLLLAVPPMVVWMLRQEHTRAALRFSTTAAISFRDVGFRVRLLRALPWLQGLALALAIVALARPQSWDARRGSLAVEGIDIVIALDLSTSMEAGDFRPNNRLFVAREVLRDFLDARINDRVGLVVFAGAAYTQVPLTLDYGVVKDVVAQLKTRVLEDGTAIGDAIAVSLNRLRESEAKSRVVVLITDGDNNAGRISPVDVAAMGKKLGVPVFTILVGKGGKVPFPVGKDLFGNTAWREMEIPINPSLLKQISETTGGEYYRATDPEELREGLQKVLSSMERSRIMDGSAVPRGLARFHLPLLLAFVIAAFELVARASFLRVFP